MNNDYTIAIKNDRNTVNPFTVIMEVHHVDLTNDDNDYDDETEEAN